ncbi:hypothetical protein FBQ82_14570 [Anaerolineae bacterium CFX7]|nr:hypothetical protein [Anaerolineae bacterium CFX7]
MDFERLLEIVGDEPVFETGLLLAGVTDTNSVRQQLSRWTQAGRLYQLRRGVYTLAPPFQKTKPHPFRIANLLVKSSYVSLHSALAYYGLIPEYTPSTTSVTTLRPDSWNTPLGNFEYRHLQSALFYGFIHLEVSSAQFAFVATPEKALLDLIHLTPRADHSAYLDELRLQNLEQLDIAKLADLAEQGGHPKLMRAARVIAERAEQARDAGFLEQIFVRARGGFPLRAPSVTAQR